MWLRLRRNFVRDKSRNNAVLCSPVDKCDFSMSINSHGVWFFQCPGGYGRGLLRWRGRGHRQCEGRPGEQLRSAGEPRPGAHQHLGAAHRPVRPVLHSDLGQVLYSCQGKVYNQTWSDPFKKRTTPYKCTLHLCRTDDHILEHLISVLIGDQPYLSVTQWFPLLYLMLLIYTMN